MGMRKIVLKNCTKCPKCGGLSGIRFYKKAMAECRNFWGCSPSDSVVEGVKYNKESTVKTAVCIDCETRFEIVE